MRASVGGVAGLVALACTVTSAAARGQGLTLEEAQAEARQHAPEAAELEAARLGADLVADDAARALRHDPTLTAQYETGALTGSAEEYAVSLGASWTVDLSGSSAPRRQAGRAGREWAGLEREAGLRALDEAVAGAWADAALGQEALGRAERVQALYAVALDAENERLEAGAGNALDADAAELDAAAAAAEVARARGALDQARTQLARLLGRASPEGLTVDDPVESVEAPAAADLERLVGADPRVLAAAAERDAAQSRVELYEDLAAPAPTLGLEASFRWQDVPPEAFRGPASDGLSALWSDWELGLRIGLPLPLFDAQREQRAHAGADLLAAEARLERVRADVRQDLEGRWVELSSAIEAYQAVSGTGEVIARDFERIESAMRAGALDVTTRALSLRRLEEAGSRLDEATRRLRVARARWRTVAQGP